MSIFTNKEEATVFTYHLVDGSYIMAEEVDYDFEDNVIFVINPVKIAQVRGKYQLMNWGITEPSQPVQLKDDMIIASSAAPTALKHNYFQFNMLNIMSNTLPKNEFDEIINLLFSGIDSKDTSEEDEETEFDFDKQYEIKKEKKKNPWDRY
tara:strand:- start:5071 stop:5523 length:453 start_codon:yes stop_codon:yes gene_type:complete